MANATPKKSGRTSLILMAVAALAAGYLLSSYLLRNQAANTPTVSDGGPAAVAKIGSKRPEFTLPDVEGKPRSISEWNGKVVLVNFWATWCPPCRKEMPGFIELRDQYHDKGFEIVGVAIDEAGAVSNFVDGMGVSYPVVVGQNDASDVTRQYGNRLGALPFSVLIDRQGIIRYTRAGELPKGELEALIQQYL